MSLLQYSIMMFFMLTMIGLPLKMMLRLHSTLNTCGLRPGSMFDGVVGRWSLVVGQRPAAKNLPTTNDQRLAENDQRLLGGFGARTAYPRQDPVVTKSYATYYVVSMVLLMATLFWALWDEAVGQRPWKAFQQEWKDATALSLRPRKSTRPNPKRKLNRALSTKSSAGGKGC